MNLDGVGLEQAQGGRQSHNELLRQAFQMAKPMLLEPYAPPAFTRHAGREPDDFVVLCPIQVEKQPAGWRQSGCGSLARSTVGRPRSETVSELRHSDGRLRGQFRRNQQGRRPRGQEQIWSQLEGFAREVHASLEPTRVAYK